MTPGDLDWDESRQAWNVAVTQEPLAVLFARSADDVVAAVQWAVRHEVPVAVQPTGHGAAREIHQELLIRTGDLDEITIDAERRIVRIGAGVRAGDLVAALDGTGLTFLVGSSPGPSVVGLTTSGGLSWFGRRYGLGVDSIRSLDLVDGLGQLHHVTSADAELFWAVRGAAGEMGIITAIELELHPVTDLSGGRLVWPAEETAGVLRAFREITATAPPELTAWFQVLHLPPDPALPDGVRGRSFAVIAVTHLGDIAELRDLLAPVKGLPDPEVDSVRVLPLAEIASVAEDPIDPMPTIERGRLLEQIDDEVARRLVDEVGDRETCRLAMFQIRHLGGAFRAEGNEPSAVGPVAEEFLLFALGVPVDDHVAGEVRTALDRLADAVEPCSSGRAPLSFQGIDGIDRWWDPATIARLRRVKHGADPLGLIRSNRPLG